MPSKSKGYWFRITYQNNGVAGSREGIIYADYGYAALQLAIEKAKQNTSHSVMSIQIFGINADGEVGNLLIEQEGISARPKWESYESVSRVPEPEPWKFGHTRQSQSFPTFKGEP